MRKKRELKDTVQDPLVIKAIPDCQSKSNNLPAQRPKVNIGKMVFVSAVAVGFICGWLAGRFIRVI